MQNNDIEIKTFTNPYVDEKMYVIIDNNKSLIIDPFASEIAKGILVVSGVRKVKILLTHEHFDHISGVNFLRSSFDTTVVASNLCKENIENSKKNTTSSFPILFLADKKKYKMVKSELSLPYFCSVDKQFYGRFDLNWDNHSIECIPVGGHSPGSSIYVVDKTQVFVGDNLLGNGMELNSYRSSIEQYENNVVPIILGFDNECVIYPGHGERKSICEYKEYIIGRKYKIGN